ncbi:hypothetical protein LINGRAHAP2_LOCUS29483 [Linum grandiflorum]
MVGLCCYSDFLATLAQFFTLMQVLDGESFVCSQPQLSSQYKVICKQFLLQVSCLLITNFLLCCSHYKLYSNILLSYMIIVIPKKLMTECCPTM